MMLRSPSPCLRPAQSRRLFASAQDAPQDEDAPHRHHALSLIGKPKYPADFKHFDYVNPDAPKGGLVRMADIGSFDSLNPILYKGEPPAGLGLVYESLMQDSLDEPSTSYGLIAEWASYPPDFSSVTFKLRDEARWHDGKPITPEDVIYSLEVNKEANPRMGALLQERGEGRSRPATERGHLHLRRQGQSRAADDHGPAHHPAQALLDGNGRKRQAARPAEDDARAPLGSGPYRIKQVDAGAHHHL